MGEHSDPAPGRGEGAGAGRAVLDADGRFVAGDRGAFARLGLDPDVDAVRMPAYHRVAWEPRAAGELVRVGPIAIDRWQLELFGDGGGAIPHPALSADNLAAFARFADFGETVKNLSAVFAGSTGLTSPIVVLIDPSGDPTFAGGTTQDSRQLAAMEQCRRAHAPMAIWQAFEEQRLTVDARWIETVQTDVRFAAIRKLLPPVMDEDNLVYIATPLRTDRGVVGVVAGFWPEAAPITAAHISQWLASADELAVSIQFSELLRRAYVNGAEAERMRTNDDIHSGLAQSIFALSLEVARASAGNAAPQASDLQVLQGMADELSSDVREFLSDGRAGGGGTNLTRQLHDLTSELGAQTGAVVLTDHRVDWDEYSYDFADYVVRVVTEAFRNIVKHSTASRVWFTSRMSAGSSEVIIEIADDGRTEPAPRASSGVGLTLIRELTARWPGSVSFEAGEEGATLTIQVVPEYQSEWAVAQQILREDIPADRADDGA